MAQMTVTGLQDREHSRPCSRQPARAGEDFHDQQQRDGRLRSHPEQAGSGGRLQCSPQQRQLPRPRTRPSSQADLLARPAVIDHRYRGGHEHAIDADRQRTSHLRPFTVVQRHVHHVRIRRRGGDRRDCGGRRVTGDAGGMHGAAPSSRWGGRCRASGRRGTTDEDRSTSCAGSAWRCRRYGVDSGRETVPPLTPDHTR